MAKGQEGRGKLEKERQLREEDRLAQEHNHWKQEEREDRLAREVSEREERKHERELKAEIEKARLAAEEKKSTEHATMMMSIIQSLVKSKE